MPQPGEVTIKVTSDDPEKKKEKEKENQPGSSKDKQKKDGEEEEELSEEDIQLRNQLEMLVERLKESNTELHGPALETLRSLIRTSTSSMTSVPKPLKFLRPHYPALQTLYDTWSPSEAKSLFADILSVLAMTYSDTQPRGTLRYRLLSAHMRPKDSPLADPGTWGHEYIRHLAAELGEEFQIREALEAEDGGKDAGAPKPIDGSLDELRALAKDCAVFFLSHNAEPDAVDLLEEMEMITDLVELVDENTFGRTCQYMVRGASFLPPPDDITFLKTVHEIYIRHSKFPEALAVAIQLGDEELVKADFDAAANPVMKQQLAFLLGRAQTPISWVKESIEAIEAEESELITDDDAEDKPPALSAVLMECLGNVNLSTHFRAFGKELGVVDPKSLEDIYKSHLENTRTTTNVDSARANLAATFVNAFVNAGFANDKLMVMAEEGTSWVYKNKDHAMLSAAASVGLSCLWDHEMGLSHVDKYSYSSEEQIKAGALMANGILHCGIRTEIDAPLALLSDYLENKSVPLKTSAVIGLALAYTGTHREDILPLLTAIISDDSVSMEIASLAALAIGLIFVGSANGEASDPILQNLMERASSEETKKSLDEKWARFMAVGLGLVFLGVQSDSDAAIEILRAIEHPISRTAQIIVEACSFAGTGNVLRIQTMLHHCDEHINPPKDKEKEKEGDKKEEKKEGEENKEGPAEPPKDDTFQAFAVLGVSMIAMGEEIGSEMSLRQFNHLMHYGEPIIRKAVPLAIGLVSASNPQLPILDTLSKYSHDNDLQVAMNAIFAMGLVGAGTNNARLAQMLRQLAGYYYKEPDCLFVVRVAQGLVHLGKGTIGLNPFFCDRGIMNRPAVAGLLATLTAFTDTKGFILDKYHWMLYLLTPAMFPRFMLTLDEKLQSIPVTVRVGQAVDVVGQAGKPRTISGFQTHQTPVRLDTTQRAELATEEFIPFAHVLESFVILQKNPGWEKEDKMDI